VLTFEDCLAFVDLDEEEIDAIIEHEHLPGMLALELGNYLCHCKNGEPCLRRMILDDIQAARLAGNKAHAAKLKLVLRHFCETHPRALAA
jgi:hypothetical protein